MAGDLVELICFGNLKMCTNTHLDYCSNLKELKTLLELSILDANEQFELGNTMLHLAAKEANSKAIKLLLSFGADCNIRNDSDETPLFLIFSSKASNERKRECVESLMLYEADYGIVNSEGDTVVNVALKNGSFFSLQPIVAHLAWLQELDLPVDERIFDQISFVHVLKNYYRSCRSHLKEMKSTKIVEEDITEYEILTKKGDTIASYMRNSMIVRKFEQHEIHSDLYYNSLFKVQIRKALEIKRLRSDANVVFRKSIKLFEYSSHIIVDNIICYLNDQDLLTLKYIAEEEEKKEWS